MTLHFLDFEVFKHNWLVVIISPMDKKETIIVDNKEQLSEFYEKHKDDIFIGYNSRNYDNFIFKGILCGFDPYKISEHIIAKNRSGWSFSRLMNEIPLNGFDMMPTPPVSLKTLEAFMGHNIKETSVPFDIERKLTPHEVEEVIKYCRHDVEELMEVFVRRKEEFDVMTFLIKYFKMPASFMGKTKAQLVAKILGGNSKGKAFNDEYDYKILNCVKIRKYTRVLDFFQNAKNDALSEMRAESEQALTELKQAREDGNTTKIRRLQTKLDELNVDNPDCFRKFFYNRSCKIDVAGVPHVFKWGGIHGASEQPYVGEGIYIMADVEAYYPSMAIVNEFGKRVMDNWDNFQLIHSENKRLKHIDKKARKPFKIADNGITGQFKDIHSIIYDPNANNCICVNGQLMLLDLIERLEESQCCELIQSNTDGLLLKLHTMKDFETIDDIVFEWETRTGMKMEFELYKKVFQGDVNNYCIVGMDDHIKTKGAYVKELNELDNDLPIVNKAITNYMINGKPVEETIGECDNFIEFQKVVKVSKLYKYAMHNGHTLTDKTFRVFASKDESDTTIYKVKNSEKNPEKFANTPDHCFIENGDVSEMSLPDKLDTQWYINLAKQRLQEKFGIGGFTDGT